MTYYGTKLETRVKGIVCGKQCMVQYPSQRVPWLSNNENLDTWIKSRSLPEAGSQREHIAWRFRGVGSEDATSV